MPAKTALASPEEPKHPRTGRRTRANNESSITRTRTAGQATFLGLTCVDLVG